MRTYAIGDIHGHLDLLRAAHELIARDDAAHGGGGRLVHVGDLQDRGPDSRGVVDYLMRGQAERLPWIVLKGNHDRFLPRFAWQPEWIDPGLASGRHWLEHPSLGAAETLASYGVEIRDPARTHAEVLRAVPEAHLRWLDALPEHFSGVLVANEVLDVMPVHLLVSRADGLFERVTHGGRSHRTAYLPRWDRLNAIVDDWDLRMKDGSPPRKVAELRRSRSQDCDVEGRKNATQTDRRNRQKEPTVQVEGSEDGGGVSHRPASQDRRNGLRKNSEPQPQRFLVHAITGGKAPSRQVAAEAAVERRRADEIGKLPRHEREAAWLAAMGDRP